MDKIAELNKIRDVLVKILGDTEGIPLPFREQAEELLKKKYKARILDEKKDDILIRELITSQKGLVPYHREVFVDGDIIDDYNNHGSKFLVESGTNPYKYVVFEEYA